MPSLPNPSDHPNAAAAVVAGYLATAIIYGCKQAGVEITLPEATSAATAVIALVIFLAGKKKTPPAAK
jgi:hypothetical protein